MNGKDHESQIIEITVAKYIFSFEIDADCSLDLSAAVEQFVEGQKTFLIRFDARRSDEGSFAMKNVSLGWDVPLIDMHGFFCAPPSPTEMAELPYWKIHKRTGANYGLPFISLFHRSGENRASFGLLDQLTETGMYTELSELTGCYHFQWRKPISQNGLVVDRWEEILFLSAEEKMFIDVYRDYILAVEREWPQPKMPVPEKAFEPVFCTWTAVHHSVNQAWVLHNARLAADLGFRTWLTDDGWFTDKATFADYSYAGDWTPCLPKFPDFSGHVKAVQAMGLNYVLWVAPFMVGHASRAARVYGHLLSEPITDRGFSNLSPQRAESGEIIVRLLAGLVRDYHLDGLKLDFIGRISPDSNPYPGLDYATQGEGIYAILSRAIDRLREIEPDALIEFRYPYANLASRRYANVYRAYDSPFNPATNRWQVVMLRLSAPDRAIHLDPGVWRPDDSDENVAVYLINLLVSVPMIGIDLEKYPQSHLDLIRHWMAFYREHRETIIQGEFAPEFHMGRVPVIRFNGDYERIVALYDDIPLTLEGGPMPLWILNASTRPLVELLSNRSIASGRILVYDKFGRCVGSESFQSPIQRIPVEVGGSLEMRSL